MGQSFRVIWISDFAPQGSGYLNISVPLCTGLTNLGHDVKVIGLSYDGRQNDYPFNCVPCANFNDAMAMITNLKVMFNPDFCVVALDIPLQENFLKILAEKKIPHIAITPLECDPLCFSWANLLSMISKVFIISEFGANECKSKGIESAEHIEVGVDTDFWRKRTQAEKDGFREGLGIPKDSFVILTVADNQERKNLSKSLEIVSKFKKVTGCKLRYLLVTREKSPVGWKLRDLAMEYDVSPELMIFERGMSQEALWGIFAASDAFLLTSKGEGLGMPVLEAMSVGVPVVASGVGALTEHLTDGRGFLLGSEYDGYRDPWGNEKRFFASTKDGITALDSIWKGIDIDQFVERARAYVEGRKWKKPTDQLVSAMEIIHEAKNKNAAG